MAIRRLALAAAALTIASITNATAQSAYVDQFTPSPTVRYLPSDVDGYVIEQRYVPVAPTTYEQQIIAPSSAIPVEPAQEQVVIERRIERPVVAARTTKSVKAVNRKTARAVPTEVITERRIVTRAPTAPLNIVEQPRPIPTEPSTMATTETTGVSASCRYDLYGRYYCD